MADFLRFHNAWGASASYYALSLKKKRTPLAIVAADSKQIFETIVAELKFFAPTGVKVLEFPPYTMSPFEETRPLNEIMGKRAHAINEMCKGGDFILVLTPYSLLKQIPLKNEFASSVVNLAKKQLYPIDQLAYALNILGYIQVEFVNGQGEFNIRGGIADIFPISSHAPLRIEYFDEEIENMFLYNPETQTKIANITNIDILPASDLLLSTEEFVKNLTDEKLKEKGESYGKFGGYHWCAPVAGGKMSSVLDYLPADINLAILLQDINESCRQIYEEAKDVVEKNSLPSQFMENFSDPRFVESFFMEKNAAYITETASNIESSPLSFASSKTKFTYEKINIYQSMKKAMELVLKYYETGYQAIICVESDKFANIFKEFSRDYNIFPPEIENIGEAKEAGVYLYRKQICGGFMDDKEKIAIISDLDIFGFSKRKPKQRKKDAFNTTLADLEEGDYIVHINHGVGIYKGIKHLTIAGVEGDFLHILYDGDDVLYVPLQSITQIQKYIGLQDHKPKLNSLKSSAWAKLKKHAKESAKAVAEDLLRLYAERKTKKGFPFLDNGEVLEAFERDFEYTETEDQLSAILDVYKDMENEIPMERLICGDVGFGKTEVAMRAACKASACGKQTAVLVPTTILARQHYETFTNRFKNTPVTVDFVSRFRSNADVKTIFEKTARGAIDILIGTHKLLSHDLAFKDLGLLVIDEEQRFGVGHKEKIAGIKRNVDTLTLSATPIPRTLQLSLSGIRDMSIIETPPENRLPVIVKVIKNHDDTAKAIKSELERGGQVFFLHNKVSNIQEITTNIKNLVPHAKVDYAHGQMDAKSLERILQGFYAGEIDVLISTTIIENGVDIPNVNTMIINDAGHFGLSQLYQLKGRVGRSTRRGYCYLLVPNFSSLTPVAQKRLTIIQQLADLGSGFKIAMYDLQLRGAGNILGAEQSGFVVRVGYELYVTMIEEAVAEMKGEFKGATDTEINSNIPYFIPATFVENPRQRFDYYRRFSQAASAQEIEELLEELETLGNELPQEVYNLGYIMLIKNIASKLGAVKMTIFQTGAKIEFSKDAAVSPQIIEECAHLEEIKYRFSSEYELALSVTSQNVLDSLVKYLSKLENKTTA